VSSIHHTENHFCVFNIWLKKILYFSFNFISLFGSISVPKTYITMRGLCFTFANPTRRQKYLIIIYFFFVVVFYTNSFLTKFVFLNFQTSVISEKISYYRFPENRFLADQFPVFSFTADHFPVNHFPESTVPSKHVSSSYISPIYVPPKYHFPEISPPRVT
jgi:hypothetical protein